MVVCPYCGKENVDGSAFCSECGAPLKAASEAAATAQMFDQQETAGSFEPNAGAFGAQSAASGFDAGSSHDFGGQPETLTQPTYDSTFEQPAGAESGANVQPAGAESGTDIQPAGAVELDIQPAQAGPAGHSAGRLAASGCPDSDRRHYGVGDYYNISLHHSGRHRAYLYTFDQ